MIIATMIARIMNIVVCERFDLGKILLDSRLKCESPLFMIMIINNAI